MINDKKGIGKKNQASWGLSVGNNKWVIFV